MIHIGLQNAKSTISAIDEDQIQPNAVDLRLERVFEVQNEPFEITEQTKKHRTTKEQRIDEEGFFHFETGKCYDVVMKEEVTIAAGEAGWLVARSTLNRNGLFITSGLYDSGFKGKAAGILHVEGGPAKIKRGTRVAQFLLFAAETAKQYDGDYGKDAAGNAKTMEKQLYNNDSNAETKEKV